MATISENLEALKTAKTNIKSAIEGKGQDLTNVPFTEYSEKIANIQTKEDLEPDFDYQETLLLNLQKQVDELPENSGGADVSIADAIESDVLAGKTFFSGDTELKTGTLVVPDLSATTATEEDVFEGKKFYNAQGEFVNGGYKDMLQRRIDDTKSCDWLFYKYALEEIPYLNKLDTSQAISMTGVFEQCNNLKTIDLSNFNIANVIKMNSFFAYCYEVKLLDLSGFDTRNVTEFNSMFFSCYALETILGEIDMIMATKATNMFFYATALQDVTLKNIKISFYFTNDLLTNETLINTIQQLWDNTNNALGGSRTLTLSTASKEKISNIYVKLIPVTDEMRAEDLYIDNKKPCVVCESTDEGAMTLTEYAISKNWAIA